MEDSEWPKTIQCPVNNNNNNNKNHHHHPLHILVDYHDADDEDADAFLVMRTMNLWKYCVRSHHHHHHRDGNDDRVRFIQDELVLTVKMDQSWSNSQRQLVTHWIVDRFQTMMQSVAEHLVNIQDDADSHNNSGNVHGNDGAKGDGDSVSREFSSEMFFHENRIMALDEPWTVAQSEDDNAVKQLIDLKWIRGFALVRQHLPEKLLIDMHRTTASDNLCMIALDQESIDMIKTTGITSFVLALDMQFQEQNAPFLFNRFGRQVDECLRKARETLSLKARLQDESELILQTPHTFAHIPSPNDDKSTLSLFVPGNCRELMAAAKIKPLPKTIRFMCTPNPLAQKHLASCYSPSHPSYIAYRDGIGMRSSMDIVGLSEIVISAKDVSGRPNFVIVSDKAWITVKRKHMRTIIYFLSQPSPDPLREFVGQVEGRNGPNRAFRIVSFNYSTLLQKYFSKPAGRYKLYKDFHLVCQRHKDEWKQFCTEYTKSGWMQMLTSVHIAQGEDTARWFLSAGDSATLDLSRLAKNLLKRGRIMLQHKNIDMHLDSLRDVATESDVGFKMLVRIDPNGKVSATGATAMRANDDPRAEHILAIEEQYSRAIDNLQLNRRRPAHDRTAIVDNSALIVVSFLFLYKSKQDESSSNASTGQEHERPAKRRRTSKEKPREFRTELIQLASSRV